MDRFTGSIVLGIPLSLCILILNVLGCSPASNETNEIIEPALANAGPVKVETVGSLVVLDGTGSSGTGASYHWTLRSKPPGSEARVSGFESISSVFLADVPGTYVAQLIVMDKAEGTSKDFTTVTIESTPGELVSSTSDLHTGTTDSCQTCHNGIDAAGKSDNHIESTNECAVCHGTTAWTPNIAIDHNEILGTCSTCHNGTRAPGKPDTHIATSAECNLCHNAGTTFTLAIMPVGILHEEEGEAEHPPIGDAMCVDCHNNVIEEGKPDDHIPASDNCENCHTTTGWEDGITNGGSGSSDDDDDDDYGGGGNNDHPPIGNLMCFDCHNNVIEEGKEDDHILTTDMCEACHNTNDWEPVVTVDHVEVIGVCSSCHDNDTAQGKPPGHVVTSAECNSCHGTAGWTPLISEGGGGSAKTVDHSGFTQATVCMDCHNGVIATGKPVSHVITSSDCDVCHTTSNW